jgi:hypothetical protein
VATCTAVCLVALAASAVSVEVAGAATTSTTTAARGVPLQSPKGGEFLSPSGNISCEVDYGYAGLHQVYCQTFSPPRSVIMSTSGALKTCSGEKCLGNPADGIPTLAYGTSTGTGPFRCLSTRSGVICTVRSGKGFKISRSGILVVRPH